MTAALFAAALLGALVSPLCFAPAWAGFLAPLVLTPLFTVLALAAGRPFKETARREFLACWLFGFLFYLANIWWIGHVSVAGMLAIAAFLGLIMALVLLLASWLLHRGAPPVPVLAAAYLLYEILAAYICTGFPWLSLGYALSGSPVLIQAADLGGVHLVSLPIVLAAAALGAGAASRAWRRALCGLVWPALAFLALGAYGLWRGAALQAEPPVKIITAGLVQLNLPPEYKHDPAMDERTLDEYLARTRELAASSPDVVIWPETGVPGIYNDYVNPAMDRLRAFHREVPVPLLCGLSWAERREGEIYFYNAAALLDNAAMQPVSRYYKKHLVLFGEYVPLEKTLPILKRLTPIAGSYSPGARSHSLPLKSRSGSLVRMGALVCFEDVFPALSREAVREGADVLVDITNDGWFWDSPGPYQHAAIARFRAVENRRSLVRSSNTGVTAVYDRLGRETALLEKEGRKVLIPGTLLAPVEVYGSRTALYTAWGDWPLAGLAALVLALLARQKKAPGQAGRHS